eukprot:CAMPEP_0198115976 /NCGR_PEP_ID=MMETSP1442-20131203/8762_1 /TAXON_ID= /ORGANISM="Craspedostauros australis, Strain CCMP3328" /LENGTH=296 /DNA_ID=CAMNT_0043773625 /DNA_START=183 /DNA_END=1073 /DNA_ORIENTATION=+
MTLNLADDDINMLNKSCEYSHSGEAGMMSTGVAHTIMHSNVESKHVQSLSVHNYQVMYRQENIPSCKALLPKDYKPRSVDVICARGKSWWNHGGNVRYRSLIAAASLAYSKAMTKLQKTVIVSQIADSVYRCIGSTENIDNGMFVKREKNGQWVEVTEHFAREKIGQSLRDSLHDQYRSSTKAKQKRRKSKTTPPPPRQHSPVNIEEVVHSNVNIRDRMARLSWDVGMQGGQEAADTVVMSLFSEANVSVLDTIKGDPSLLHQLQPRRSPATIFHNVEATPSTSHAPRMPIRDMPL